MQVIACMEQSNRQFRLETRRRKILRGVAQAQDEINQGNKVNGRGIKVLIADDENKPAQDKQIAEKLLSKKDILAVVGHFSSDTFIVGVEVYQQRKILMISPTTTSADLSYHLAKWYHALVRLLMRR